MVIGTLLINVDFLVKVVTDVSIFIVEFNENVQNSIFQKNDTLDKTRMNAT